TKSLSITISVESSPLTITTRSLPDGRRNQPYADTLEASGGVPPYTWSVTPPLPTGLTLTPTTGELSGTPTTTSTTRHDFTVRDSANQTSTIELRLRIRDTSDDD
ncbi:MAG: putative Ig domain-containing protein, partial [Nitrospirales bacterium]